MIFAESPHTFIHSYTEDKLDLIIQCGTYELAARQARQVLISALHGILGYTPTYHRETASSYPSRQQILLQNEELLLENGIDVSRQTIMKLLAGPTSDLTMSSSTLSMFTSLQPI